MEGQGKRFLLSCIHRFKQETRFSIYTPLILCYSGEDKLDNFLRNLWDQSLWNPIYAVPKWVQQQILHLPKLCCE